MKNINIPFLQKNNQKEKNENSSLVANIQTENNEKNKYENIPLDQASTTEEIATSTVDENFSDTQASSTDNDINSFNEENLSEEKMIYETFKDSDGDMLYDYEEAVVYGTDHLNPDSDGDGFSDKQEIDGGYNPKGSGTSTQNTPEFLLKTIENARHACSAIEYKNKINYLTEEQLSTDSFSGVENDTENFIKNINDKMDEWLESAIPENIIKKIIITKKETGEENKEKLSYRIFYEDPENNEIFIDNSLFFININGEWKIDNHLNTFNEMTPETAEIELAQEKIISDIGEIQNALNIYYLDHGFYPENIYPDIASGTTIYLSTPLNRNKNIACPQNQKYSYKTSTNTDYTLTYCLEKETEDIPSGINTAKPGILSVRKNFQITYKNCYPGNGVATSSSVNETENTDEKINENNNSEEESEEKTEEIDLQNKDSDDDGISDIDELIYKTDPNNPDTDGDGYTDGDEINNGYNPNGEGLLI